MHIHTNVPMKPVSLALLFVLFTLSTKLVLTTAVNVYDVDGHPVVNGGSSYYASFDAPGGGPVTLAKVGNETRPTSVVLGSFEERIKRPVKFVVRDDIIAYYVPTNFALDVEFTYAPVGVDSSQWTVGSQDLFVRIGNQEQGTLPGIFKIKKNGAGHIYRIVFCPHGEVCFPLGAERVDSGNYQFIVTDGEPLTFVFERVEVGSATSAI